MKPGHRALAAVLGLGLGASGAVAAWVWPRLEWGEVAPRWIPTVPPSAVKDHYDRFFFWRGGPAWRAWEEGWLERAPPRPDGPLLIDRTHTSKQPWDADIGMESFNYSEMHGFAPAFAPLRAAGVDVEPVRTGWSGRVLAGASAVFINLVSGDNPPLRTSEVVALEAFVRRGGGLVLITDHSNCYFHAEMLLPLTTALGITIPPVTAADPTNRLTPRSVSWMKVYAESDHPVMAGVHALGFMTAGGVEGLPGLAFTSPESWFDAWEPYRKEDSSGFTGDLERDPEERPGPVPVVAAGTHGAGRVVVMADQNAFGAALIGYEDNGRLFTNALAWAMGRPVPPREPGAETVTTLMGEGTSPCTSVADDGFRTFQTQAQRWAALTGKGEACTTGDAVGSGAFVVLPQDARDVDAILTARRVLVVLDPTAPITDPLLSALGLARAPEDPRTAVADWVVERPAPDVPMLDAGGDAVEARPMAVTGPMDVWMADVLGRPVVAVIERGPPEDRRRVILLLDADLLRNGALGKERDDPRKGLAWGGSSPALAAHRLAHRLLAELYLR